MSQGRHEFNDGTSEIIAAALEVHNTLGPGFQEVIYQRALFYELAFRGIEFSREAEITVFYKGKKVGKKRVDFFAGACLIEIKAKAALEDVDFIQTLSYLRAAEKNRTSSQLWSKKVGNQTNRKLRLNIRGIRVFSSFRESMQTKLPCLNAPNNR